MSTAVPVRYPSGVTMSNPGELLALYGNPNPFQLHRHEDDFDWLGATATKYTITAAGGSVAKSAGDGGTILFTTGAVATNFAAIQLPSAGFTPVLGQRMWFAARVAVEDVSAAQVTLGLIQTTATPGTITDGIVIEKAAAATAWTLKHYVGSAASLTLTFPAAAFTPVNNAAFDIGFYVDGKGYLFGFAATVANGGLFGYQPQNNALPERGALVGGQIPTLTTVSLNPTMVVFAGASGAELMTGDFVLAAKERT